MDVGKQGLDLIKHFEGFRALAYQDEAGIWTIGYGTIKINGVPVKQGDICDEEMALDYMHDDLQTFVAHVNRVVKVPLKQHQFDALVCFTYNVGVGALSSSTLLKQLNAGIPIVEKRFTDWNKVTVKGVLTPSTGLTRRRKAEFRLFSTGQVVF